MGVVIAHCGAFGPAGGTTAVEAFFVISGFYMSLIFATKYRGQRAPFLWSRLTRLYPTYLAALSIALAYYAIAYSFGIRTFFSDALGVADRPHLTMIIALNLSVLFSEILWFIRPFDITGLALTPIWTLSLEFTFYFLCPMLLRWRSLSLLGLCAFLIVTRIIAYRCGLDAPPWHARFFPFELPYFVAGVLAHRAYSAGIGTTATPLITVTFAMVIFYKILTAAVPLPQAYQQADYWHSQVLVSAVAISLPALFEASKDSLLDRNIGELSYPIYAIHYVFVELFAFRTIPSSLAASIVLSLTLVHAIALYWFVQRPVDRSRQGHFAVD